MVDADRGIIFQQLIEAVEYIHQNGLIHRDIKPGNVSILSLTPPKSQLIDFGSATIKTESTNHMTGTIKYLAPEIIALKKGITQRPYTRAVDIWSLGISAYQLLRRKYVTWSSIDTHVYTCLKEELIMAENTGTLAPLLDIAEQMIRWSASERISALEALRSISNGNTHKSAEANLQEFTGAKRKIA